MGSLLIATAVLLPEICPVYPTSPLIASLIMYYVQYRQRELRFRQTSAYAMGLIQWECQVQIAIHEARERADRDTTITECIHPHEVVFIVVQGPQLQ